MILTDLSYDRQLIPSIIAGAALDNATEVLQFLIAVLIFMLLSLGSFEKEPPGAGDFWQVGHRASISAHRLPNPSTHSRTLNLQA